MFNLIKATESGKNHKRVFTKPRHQDYYVARDLICLDYDLISAEWSMTVNALTFTGKGYRSLKEHLDTLCDESEARKRKKEDREKTRILIMTEPLQYLTMQIKDIYDVPEENVLIYTNSEGKRIVSEVDTGRILFRNFRSFVDIKKEDSVDDKKPYSDIMSAIIIRMYDEYIPSQFRYTAASMANKKFYRPIPHETLMKERGKSCVFRNMGHYNDSMTGCKRGYLKKIELDDLIDGTAWSIHKDVFSFDKKSAYQSKFVTDRVFPLGETFRHTNNKISILETRIRDCKWFKIVLHPLVKNDFSESSFMRTFYDKRFHAYGIDYWDFKSIELAGHNEKFMCWLKENEGDWVLLTSEKTGYMPKVFRDRVMELFLMKDVLSKDDPLRKGVKQMLETLYGKSIQNYGFTRISNVKQHYEKNPEKFISPNQALHALAAVKYEIIYLIKALDDKVISYDTDGIKILGRNQSIIDAMNDAILEKNKQAGYEDSDIGIWKLEFHASRFIQFNTKQYAYDLNHIEGNTPDIHWTMAGLNKESIELFLNDIGQQDPFDYLIANNGYHFTAPAGYIYIKDTKTFMKSTEIKYIRNVLF